MNDSTAQQPADNGQEEHSSNIPDGSSDIEGKTPNETKEDPEAIAEINVEDLHQQVRNEKDKFLRLYAEFENFRRRTAKERIDLIGTANSELIRDMLPVLDDFERAIESNKTLNDISAVKFGFDLLFQKMSTILAAKGLKAYRVKGEIFDAEIHEAIAQVPTTEQQAKGKIIEEVECGYKLHDKTLRHPKVVVGS
jgi:molecular chaperone GrpE